MPSVARAQEVSWGRGGVVWDLYDDGGKLIGWTLDVPSRSMTTRPAFDYHTGNAIPVQYSSLTQYVRLT